jgi:HEAT repeat protein
MASDPPPEAVPAALAEAARRLSSPARAERDEAEGQLIRAREAAVPALVELLKERGRESATASAGAQRAALLLGALKARAALPALYELVEAEALGADVRPIVARALAEIIEGQDAFDDRCRAALERLAADADRSTRAFAAQAFGSLGDLRSRSRVQALAQDKDPWVREKAAVVLARLAETEALAQADIQPADFASLVAQAEAEGGALKPYLDDLGDPRRAVRDAAVAELVRAGRRAVPWLIDRLNQPHPRARIGAATALGRLQATEAAGPLLIAATAPAATAEERELRAVALRALASCLTGMEDGLAPSLLPLARDPDRFVRAAALLCLGRLADRAGLRAIVAAILEDDPFVVESAAVALSEGVREEDTEIIRPLLLALDRRSAAAAVIEAILIALSRVQIDEAPLRVRVRHRVRREVHGQTASTRKAAIVLLERLYGDDDPPPLPLMDDVLVRLADDHPEVRLVSASFLRNHLPPGMSHALSALAAAVRRGEVPVGLLALEAMRRHDTPEAQAALEAARAGAAGPVAARAAELLEGFVPGATLWTFTSKIATPAAEPAGAPMEPGVGADASRARPEPPEERAPRKPARPESQRPGRVRPAGAVIDRGTVVEARFDGGAAGAEPGSAGEARRAPTEPGEGRGERREEDRA